MIVDFDKIDSWKKSMSVSSYSNTVPKVGIQEETKEQIRRNAEELNRVFESGSRRDSDTHKPITTAITAYARLRYGYHLRKGSNNYGKDNWKLGQPSEAVLESMDRHLAQYLGGDRSEDHLSAIMFGVIMLMQNEEKEGIKPDNYFEK